MASFQRINLSSIESRLRARVENEEFWVNAEFQTAFNEALCIWQALTGTWTRKFSRPVIASSPRTPFYQVPHQIVSVQRVLWNSIPLTPSALPEQDLGNPGWEDSASTTPLYWAPSGINEVAVFPPPSTGSLTFEGVMEAPLLQLAGDKVELGDEELTPLLQYAHHVLSFKEGGVEFQSTTPFMQKFVEAAGLKNSRLQATNFYKRWMGIDKSEGERPPRSFNSAGIRG